MIDETVDVGTVTLQQQNSNLSTGSKYATKVRHRQRVCRQLGVRGDHPFPCIGLNHRLSQTPSPRLSCRYLTVRDLAVQWSR